MKRFLWLALVLCLSCCATAPVTAGGRVALSFDDGPWSRDDRTAQILNVLDEEGVAATFCLVGQMVATPYGRAMVQRMYKRKDELCNHSWSHQVLRQSNIASQVTSNDAAIGNALGIPAYKTPILRAPEGNRKHLRDQRCYDGRPFVGWGPHGDSDDYRFSGAHVLQIADHLPDGEILLLHDMHEPPERLRQIIRRLKARGMSFVHASELWKNPCGTHIAGK